MPSRLKDDAIIEAVCQLHFTSPDMPEVVVGRLSDFPDAQSYQQKPLPVADIPAPIRRNDPNLRTQPVLQLARADGCIVQIGERMVSAHVVGVGKYPGWDGFRQHLSNVFGHLFEKVRITQIDNISLRYINALVPRRHFVDGPRTLNVEIKVAGELVSGPVNLNFSDSVDQTHKITTRIADTSFVQGTLPTGATTVVDVEVVFGKMPKTRELSPVLEWIDEAHRLEKQAFFRLFPIELVNKLKEA